jgi:hypothetical protein
VRITLQCSASRASCRFSRSATQLFAWWRSAHAFRLQFSRWTSARSQECRAAHELGVLQPALDTAALEAMVEELFGTMSLVDVASEGDVDGILAGVRCVPKGSHH